MMTMMKSGAATPSTSGAATTVATSTTTTTTTSATSSSSSSLLQDGDQQLSNDLAQFLSNPSLQQALADGSLDLTSYSEQVQDELQALEQECIQVYREKALEDIPTLSYELEECDAVLSNLQEMLLGLQADVSGVSGDLRQLQELSRTLSIQCHNRKRAKEGLEHYLQHVVVAPTLVYTLCRGTVPSTLFCQAIEELQHLYQDTHDTTHHPEWSCQTPPALTVAAQEQRPRMETLYQVAVVRIRDYFVSQLYHVQQHPQTNVRMLQVHGLLKYTALQEFLQHAAPNIAQEIYHLYLETISKTLYALFRTYQAQLYQLDSTKQNSTRLDVIAIEDAVLRDAVTTKAKKRFDSLALSSRLRVLEQIPSTTSTPTSTTPQQHQHNQQHQQQNNNNPVILAHVALAEHSKYPYEMLFRSLLQHLLDAVTNEHVVCRQFFHRDAFHKLFPPTLSLLLEQLETYLFSCHDAICLLLLIKVTHQYQRMAKARRITSLDPWYDQVTKLIWPRLKIVMDGHLRSLQTATASKLGGVDLHAHYVSRRFAEFTCSILLILHNHPSSSGGGANTNTTASSRTSLSASTPTPLISRRSSGVAASDAGSVTTSTTTTTTSPSAFMATTNSNASSPLASPPPVSRHNSATFSSSSSAGEKLLQDLANLQDEFILLLERLSESHTTTKQRVVFMINNLDQIVCLFQERRVVGKELNRFIELLMAQREMFVEEELLQSFSKMIAFVQQTESHLRSASTTVGGASAAAGAGSSNSLERIVNAQVVEALVRDFSSNWKTGMEQINKNVLSYFSNFRNGMEILKQVLTQLLLYYTRFQDVIRKVWRNKPPAFCKDLVSTNVILTEIKKYALAI